jgi:hypothetical protein
MTAILFIICAVLFFKGTLQILHGIGLIALGLFQLLLADFLDLFEFAGRFCRKIWRCAFSLPQMVSKPKREETIHSNELLPTIKTRGGTIKVKGARIEIVQQADGEITITLDHRDEPRRREIFDYLHREGLLEAIVSGNLNPNAPSH